MNYSLMGLDLVENEKHRRKMLLVIANNSLFIIQNLGREGGVFFNVFFVTEIFYELYKSSVFSYS